MEFNVAPNENVKAGDLVMLVNGMIIKAICIDQGEPIPMASGYPVASK